MRKSIAFVPSPGARSCVQRSHRTSGYATFIGKDSLGGTTKSALITRPTANALGYTSTPTADQKFATLQREFGSYSHPDSS